MRNSSLPRAALGIATVLALTGCARQAYAPRPIDVEAAAAAYEARRTDDPGLRDYMVAHGRPATDWPLREWGLEDLTLVAFYYRPELEVARAQARAARAQLEAASQRSPLTVSPRIEHHSEDGAQDSPWSLGFEVGIPLAGQSRRAALVERAEYEAQAAELRAGAAAWAVRSQVRARMLDTYAARQRASSLEAQLEQQRSAQGLLERRLAAGYASVTDVDVARLRAAHSEADLAVARTAMQQAAGALAESLGMPLAATRDLPLSFAAFEALPDAPDPVEVQRAALTNRIDLRVGLLDFAVADAAVKLEIARQYPAFTLRPGYLWDQGDNVWSLALDLVLPAGLTHGPAIRVAEAAREAAAQQVLARQQAVIGEAAARAATYGQAKQGAAAAQAASRTQVARSSQLQRQFDVGQTDRLELTLARSEALLVEQRRLEALVDAQRHLGALEDAIQAPLAGGPPPGLPARGADAGR
jgi:outer membrane protein TolC